jgi:hypothetical protein
MEHLWSPAGATGGNQWQMGHLRKPLKQADPQPVANHGSGSKIMVRRGSTVRVRQRALQKAPRRRFLVQSDLLIVERAVVWSRSWSFLMQNAPALRFSTRPPHEVELLGWNGSAPLDSHLPSVVPGRHHCRWLDHEHNGAAKSMRTVHDAARDRHPLTGTEHERFAPLYLELKPAL